MRYRGHIILVFMLIVTRFLLVPEISDGLILPEGELEYYIVDTSHIPDDSVVYINDRVNLSVPLSQILILNENGTSSILNSTRAEIIIDTDTGVVHEMNYCDDQMAGECWYYSWQPTDPGLFHWSITVLEEDDEDNDISAQGIIRVKPIPIIDETVLNEGFTVYEDNPIEITPDDWKVGEWTITNITLELEMGWSYTLSGGYNYTVKPVENLTGPDHNIGMRIHDDYARFLDIIIPVKIIPVNDPPKLLRLVHDRNVSMTNETIRFSADANDIDDYNVEYIWYINGEEVERGPHEFLFKASGELWSGEEVLNGNYMKVFNVSCTAFDGENMSLPLWSEINVSLRDEERYSEPPVILYTTGTIEERNGERIFLLMVETFDEDSEDLNIVWTHDRDPAWSREGRMISIDDLPPGGYNFTVWVSDGRTSVTDELYVDKHDPGGSEGDGIAGVTVFISLVVFSILLLAPAIPLINKMRKKEIQDHGMDHGP